LMAPISALIDMRAEREWALLLMTTPRSVGVTASVDTLAAVAWSVLCRVPKEATVRLLGQLACLVDRYRGEPSFLQGVVRAMQAPPAIRGRLLAAARSGQPFFHPRGVRWVLCELVAASDEERRRRAAWLPSEHDHASLVARAWFRSLRGDRLPGVDEVLLATWLLHESFHGTDTQAMDADRILGAVTSIGFGFGHAGAWWPRLERALAMWTTPDNHPVVHDSPLAPRELQAIYSQELGVAVEQWLAGNWALCIRWWLGMEPVQSHPVTTNPAELFRFPMENAPNIFTNEFIASFRHHCVATLREFAEEVRHDGGVNYSGLGTLPQTDSLACRNHPVVELSDGSVILLSVELVAERVTSLPRLLLGGRGKAATAFGRMFEAYVADQIDLLRERHLVVSEAQITGVVGTSRRCDALVAQAGDYLAVETSVQTLPRTVAVGDVGSIRTMAARYQGEADQAVATLSQLPQITSALSVPRATLATYLVVSDTPVPHSPAFLAALRDLRPERTQKFICGVAELELLVQLGIRGWGVPAAIAAWQTTPEAMPLEAHLGRMAEIFRPVREPHSDLVERWVRRLPVEHPEAA
jgi:hypothetical protein